MLTVAFANNKGGTGKSTYSSVVAQIVANSGLKVAAIDLDHAQMHLSLFIKSLERRTTIPVFTHLEDVKTEQYDMVIIDTPPALPEDTINAIKKADVVVVPINRDKTGILGLREIEGHVDKKKIIVVTSQWKMKTRFNADLYEKLEKAGWVDAINIPENTLIIANRDENKSWDYRISQAQAAPYIELVQKIFTIAKGDK